MQDQLTEWLEHELTSHPLLSGPYFNDLKRGVMSREVFIATQRQFYFAVRYFSRPMAALMARTPSSILRQGLIHNLAEEHGFDDETGPPRFDPNLAHDLTFSRFLATLKVTPETMQNEQEGTAVRAFNTALMGTCLMEPTETAFGCLGAIEQAFADISAQIGAAVVSRGWIRYEDLVHYKLHSEIDKRHAADFFRIVEDAWKEGGTGQAAIKDGVRLGIHVFHRLYSDLLIEATSLRP